MVCSLCEYLTVGYSLFPLCEISGSKVESYSTFISFAQQRGLNVLMLARLVHGQQRVRGSDGACEILAV